MQIFSKTSKTWRLRIVQGGENHLDYIKHLRDVFDNWTNMPIKEYHVINKSNKIYKNWYFNTLSFEQFAEIGNAFYKLDITSGKRKKVLPPQIKDWMSDLSLAYWFMDDGSKKWKNKVLALRFCTDCFIESEIDILISVLKDKFKLNVTKTKNKNNKWRLYIGTDNYEKIKKLIYPHLVYSMVYKFPV